MATKRVESKLQTIPTSPGVYMFLQKGKPIYIGKASNLRTRTRSYFQASQSDTRYFIPWLEHEADDLDTIVVNTDKEATLLENTLIKQHRPKYNVKLKDDKEYLSLKLDTSVEWPRLELVRKPSDPKARYFGPYHSATSARRTLRLVNRHFQLRTCSDAELRSRKRPCLQHQIKRCPAPCVFEVDAAHYDEQVQTVRLFLDGRHNELLRELKQRMKTASERVAYELAAMYRDQLFSVQRVVEEQKVAGSKGSDQDTIGVFRQEELVQLSVLLIRDGKLSDVRLFDFNSSLPSEEVISSFINEYYQPGSYIPKELLLPEELEAMPGIEGYLSDLRGTKVSVSVPKRGPRLRVLSLANENAEHAFSERKREREAVETRLAEMQTLLRLPTLPRHIECIDISHDQGTRTVAAIVALKNGEPDRSRYRSFRIRTNTEGDDYAAMHEALSRRMHRAKHEDEGWDLPDLLVVDGGKGQLNTALTVAGEIGIQNLPIVGLAKERDNKQGDKLVDRVFLPGQKNPIALKSNTASLYLLAMARDEAHRSANHLRQQQSDKQLGSALDQVDGVGKKTRVKLLRSLGSIEAVTNASLEELVKAGASRTQAQNIRDQLGRPVEGISETREV